MLQITADIFSGRSQPTWIIDDERAARALLSDLADSGMAVGEQGPVDAGLGFRGFTIEALGDDLTSGYPLPATSYLALHDSRPGSQALPLAERILASLEGASTPTASPDDALPLDVGLRDFLGEQLRQIARRTEVGGTTAPDQHPGPAAEEVGAAVTCYIEFGAYNPGFWNDNATTRANNNCYNYASNWRTNTFAQPGRGCGHMYSAITCPEVSRAALCDGMHHRYNCFPDSEKPRYLVARVIAPGPGFVDYHWYRKHKEGFWGHKPGGTAARNVDNSGVIIFNPETANRGPYSIFCGYFYGCNSQRRRIR